MKVLLSIKPEYASRIFDGSKRYEYRRVAFSRAGVTTAVVYVTVPVGRVVGEFEVGEILSGNPAAIWRKTKEHAGISRKRFFDYFGEADVGYAIEIKDPLLYHTPLSVRRDLKVFPPQSFLYLMERKEGALRVRNTTKSAIISLKGIGAREAKKRLEAARE